MSGQIFKFFDLSTLRIFFLTLFKVFPFIMEQLFITVSILDDEIVHSYVNTFFYIITSPVIICS